MTTTQEAGHGGAREGYRPFEPVLPTAFELEYSPDHSLTAVAWNDEMLDARHELVQRNLEHLQPWLPWAAREPLSRPESEKLVRSWAQGRLDGGSAHYCLQLDGEAVGGIGILRKVDREAELGYFLARSQWGRGLITRAVTALTNQLLARPDTDRVLIAHDERNLRSRAVPERLGFRHVATKPAASRPDAPDDPATLWWWSRETPIG